MVATHYVMTELEDVDIEKQVVIIDAGVMIPTAIPFVEEVCDQFGWPLRVLRAEPGFWELAERFGCPTMRRRWCCYHLKIKPIVEFLKTLRPQRGEVLGIRREESKKRAELPQIMLKTKHGVVRWGYCPIIDWSETQVLRYMRQHSLPIHLTIDGRSARPVSAPPSCGDTR